MKYEDFDKRDTCLQISHYYWAKRVLGIQTGDDVNILAEMIEEECRIINKLGHRKNHTYKWSNSDGLTKWLYNKVLKYIGIDPYKGLNGDQYRAFFIYLYAMKGKAKKQLRNNIAFGFIVRLGFFPSLMEHMIMKPQAFVLFLKTYKHYKFNPLYWISRLAFHFSMKRNLKQPVKGHTTNKISLLPTMYYLGYKLPDKEYRDSIYNRYYGKNSELSTYMKLALDKLTKV